LSSLGGFYVFIYTDRARDGETDEREYTPLFIGVLLLYLYDSLYTQTIGKFEFLVR